MNLFYIILWRAQCAASEVTYWRHSHSCRVFYFTTYLNKNPCIERRAIFYVYVIVFFSYSLVFFITVVFPWDGLGKMRNFHVRIVSDGFMSSLTPYAIYHSFIWCLLSISSAHTIQVHTHAHTHSLSPSLFLCFGSF